MAVIVRDDGNVTECIPLDKLSLITLNTHSHITPRLQILRGISKAFQTESTDLPHLVEEGKPERPSLISKANGIERESSL